MLQRGDTRGRMRQSGEMAQKRRQMGEMGSGTQFLTTHVQRELAQHEGELSMVPVSSVVQQQQHHPSARRQERFHVHIRGRTG